MDFSTVVLIVIGVMLIFALFPIAKALLARRRARKLRQLP